MHELFRKSAIFSLALLGLGALAAVSGQPIAQTAHASDPAEAGSSAVRTQEQAHALARELRNTAERCGPDSVALQASFLVETLRAGAVAASEVGVEGAAAAPHQDYLRIRILTGLIFDSDNSTPQSRLSELWSKVVAPTIGKMDGFDITPGGLELALGFGMQSFADNTDRKADLSTDTVFVGRVMRIGEATLTKLAAGEIDVDGVRERVLIDGEEPWSSVAPSSSS